MWNEDLQVTVHSSSFYTILATVVHTTSNIRFGLVCVYGDPYHSLTSLIWSDICSFVYDNPSLPLLCMGDMNSILYDHEKNSPIINRTRMNIFRHLIKQCGLFDLGIWATVSCLYLD